jgi:hypothetical protein
MRLHNKYKLLQVKIPILKGPPASQKTRTMLTEVLKFPARYLFACPRVDLIEEQVKFLTDKAAELDISLPEIVSVHAGRRASVPRQMDDAAQDFADTHHAIVFVTHEGLRTGDLTKFTGWHAKIDEIPDTIVSGSFKAGAAHRQFAPIYDLVPIGDGNWWRVEPITEALRHNEFLNDTAAKPLAPFHKAVRSRAGVFVDIGDWLDAKGRGREVRWWSLWTPLVLEKFASVEIACAGFQSSLCHHVVKNWFSDRVTFEDRLIGGNMPRAQCEVRIHFFTEGHTGTTAFRHTSEGRWCLNQVARYLAQVGGVGFWSGNEVVQKYLEHWFPGQRTTPKLAGTNSLIEHTSCAFIYSSKAQSGDSAILEIFGLTKEDIWQAREIEDAMQFVMRGIIRRPEFNGTYDIYVYDRAQAEALAIRLRSAGISQNVVINPTLEAGILDYVRPDSRRSEETEKIDFRSHQERETECRAKNAERRRRSRHKDREEGIAAGTYRPRGRPSKREDRKGRVVAQE